MRAVVANVAENTTAVDGDGGVPVVKEDGVGEFPERRGEDQEQSRRHDEAQAVHGEVVVDAMEEEVQGDGGAVVGQVVVDVEEASVHAVLDDGPDGEAGEPVGCRHQGVAEVLAGEVGAVDDGGEPEGRHDVPGGFGEGFEEVAEERRAVAALVVARAVDLLQVEVFAEPAVPHLHEEWSLEVEEFVRLVVGLDVGFLAQIVLAAHARAGVDGSAVLIFGDLNLFSRLDVSVLSEALQLFQTLLRRLHGDDGERILAVLDAIHDLVGRDKADQVVVQNFPRALAVRMRYFVLHDLLDILAGPLKDQVCAAGVVVEEGSDVIDFGADGDIA